MNRKLLFPFFALCFATFGVTTRAASPKTETVSYKSGDETVSGYLVLPEGGGKHPAVLVIHEWWGLNDWVKEQTVKLAEQGYVALAVDLYRGQVATDPSEAHELMRGMPQDRAIRDLQSGFVFLATRKDVLPNRIGSIGWCLTNNRSCLACTPSPSSSGYWPS